MFALHGFSDVIMTLHLIRYLISLSQYSPFVGFFWPVLDWTLDLEDKLAAIFLQIIILASKGSYRPTRDWGFFQEVYVGRWDGITAQTKDPLGTVGCEAHMGKQTADELLTWASHHGLRERGEEREWVWEREASVCIVWVGTGSWIHSLHSESRYVCRDALPVDFHQMLSKLTP